MIMIYRWLQGLPADPRCHITSVDESEKVDLPFGRGTIDSPEMNLTAPGPDLMSAKTASHVSIEQGNPDRVK
jgi:hypothetical protein